MHPGNPIVFHTPYMSQFRTFALFEGFIDRHPPTNFHEDWDYPRGLDLLSAPPGIGITHVRRGLDRGDEFEDAVTDTDYADNGAGNDAPPGRANCHGSNENINCAP